MVLFTRGFWYPLKIKVSLQKKELFMSYCGQQRLNQLKDTSCPFFGNERIKVIERIQANSQ